MVKNEGFKRRHYLSKSYDISGLRYQSISTDRTLKCHYCSLNYLWPYQMNHFTYVLPINNKIFQVIE